jgi:hypothetical protein
MVLFNGLLWGAGLNGIPSLAIALTVGVIAGAVTWKVKSR